VTVDAGFGAEVVLSGDSIRGVGHTWGNFVGDLSKEVDTIVGHRVAPPDSTRCVRGYHDYVESVIGPHKMDSLKRLHSSVH
jgi:hypothetical protein